MSTGKAVSSTTQQRVRALDVDRLQQQIARANEEMARKAEQAVANAEEKERQARVAAENDLKRRERNKAIASAAATTAVVAGKGAYQVGKLGLQATVFTAEKAFEGGKRGYVYGRSKLLSKKVADLVKSFENNTERLEQARQYPDFVPPICPEPFRAESMPKNAGYDELTAYIDQQNQRINEYTQQVFAPYEAQLNAAIEDAAEKARLRQELAALCQRIQKVIEQSRIMENQLAIFDPLETPLAPVVMTQSTNIDNIDTLNGSESAWRSYVRDLEVALKKARKQKQLSDSMQEKYGVDIELASVSATLQAHQQEVASKKLSALRAAVEDEVEAYPGEVDVTHIHQMIQSAYMELDVEQVRTMVRRSIKWASDQAAALNLLSQPPEFLDSTPLPLLTMWQSQVQALQKVANGETPLTAELNHRYQNISEANQRHLKEQYLLADLKLKLGDGFDLYQMNETKLIALHDGTELGYEIDKQFDESGNMMLVAEMVNLGDGDVPEADYQSACGGFHHAAGVKTEVESKIAELDQSRNPRRRQRPNTKSLSQRIR